MPTTRLLECTAYCSCGHCCKWEWGLKLPGNFYIGFAPSLIPIRIRSRKRAVRKTSIPFLAKYWTDTNLLGNHYQGLTARGTYPAQSRPAILSPLSLRQVERIPGRLLLFPWRFFPRHGTIAADTRHFPFGTRMHIPGYGWGVVEDRGSAIQGPTRLDLYHYSHADANKWGRRKVEVSGGGGVDEAVDGRRQEVSEKVGEGVDQSKEYHCCAAFLGVHTIPKTEGLTRGPWQHSRLVLVMKPGESLVDGLKVPPPLKVLLKALDWARRLIV